MLATLLPLSATLAEITTDGTVGVTHSLAGPSFLIPSNLGREAGGNLFHSFRAFNLANPQSATFSGPATVQNILARVTGGPSSIDGQIRSDIAGANLLLINPAGILFGPNSSINVSGAFVATTADYIELGPGGRFGATNPADDVLTSAPPSAYGFLTATPAPITARGAALLTKADHTLALIGGDITVDGGAVLISEGGAVQMASVRAAGVLALDIRDRVAIPATDAFSSLGTVRATTATISAGTANAGGRVVIRGGRLIGENLSIHAVATRAGDGIDIQTRNFVTLGGASSFLAVSGNGNLGDTPVLTIATPNLEVSRGAAITLSSSGPAGTAGSMDLRAAIVTLSDAFIGTDANSPATGGDVRITGETMTMRDGSSILSSANSTGAAGNIRLTLGGALQMLDSSKVIAVTVAAGAGGNIEVMARTILVRGDEAFAEGDSAGIISSVDAGASGRGGNVSLTASEGITLLERGNVQTVARGLGRGGNLEVQAGSLVVNGRESSLNTLATGGTAGSATFTIAGGVDLTDGGAVLSVAERAATGGDLVLRAGSLRMAGDAAIGANAISPTEAGQAGTLRVEVAGDVEVLSGSQIVRTTSGPGSGGNLFFSAGNLLISGAKSGIAAETQNKVNGGDGGNLHLQVAGQVRILDRALVSSATQGPGTGGNITLEAGELEILGVGSAISAQAHGAGAGGQIRLTIAGGLGLYDGASITASTFAAGAGGDIHIAAGSALLRGDSAGPRTSIAAETKTGGKGGSIFLFILAPLEMRGGAQVSTATQGSGQGGNIEVTAEDLGVIGRNTGFNLQTRAVVNGGRGGSLLMRVRGDLLLSEGGTISSGTLGSGQGGNLVISAARVFIADAGSGIGAESLGGTGAAGSIDLTAEGVGIFGAGTAQVGISTRTTGPGAGGDLRLAVSLLGIVNGGAVESSTAGTGNAGNVTIAATQRIVLDGLSRIEALTVSAGGGGRIGLQAPEILLEGGSFVSTATSGDGNAGSIVVEGSRIFIASDDQTKPGGFFSGSRGSGQNGGDGGNISIITKTLKGFGAANVNAFTEGDGASGDIVITATESIAFDGAVRFRDAEADLGFDSYTGVFATSEGAGAGGSITLDTPSLSLSREAVVSTSVFGSGNSGPILVRARNVFLDGGVAPTPTGIFAVTVGEGRGGLISVATETLTATRGSGLSSSTFGPGRAGDIVVTAASVSFSESRAFAIFDNEATQFTGIAASSERGSGAGGNIRLKIGSLSLATGATISATTSGPGSGGDVSLAGGRLEVRSGGSISVATSGAGRSGGITLDVPAITVRGEGKPRTGIFADSRTATSGAGGDILVRGSTLLLDGGVISAGTAGFNPGGNVTIAAASAELRQGGVISASTSGAGRGGAVTVTATNLNIFGDGLPTGIFAESRTLESGAGGNILVRTSTLRLDGGAISAGTVGRGAGGNVTLTAAAADLRAGGVISASTSGAGRGGEVAITAAQLVITGGGAPAGIFAESLGAAGGPGGNIRVVSGNVRLARGAEISARTAGLGAGGSVTLRAGSVVLSDGSVVATSAQGGGTAGGIRLDLRGALSLSGGSSLATTSARSDAGIITVRAGGSVRLAGSTVTVQAIRGDAGNILIETPGPLVLQGSAVTAQAGGSGGNIVIDAASLDLQSSQITANAVAGDGGTITLNIPADGVLGDARDFVVVSRFVRQSPDSLISASSEQGVQGALSIQAPQVDLSNAVEGFSASFLDATTRFADRCHMRLGGEVSTFLIVGRGGVEQSPAEAQTSGGAKKRKTKTR